ncbi:glucose 1-dehydrogenase [Paenibacillus aceris]|uniref:Glucose 1-dehydrogenase n=1 Tax=Paenibacillus aceris TaxID=869555 RepID=A0ABS4I217_9BACL|nr:glucose 1-dehydrogenase [Paenibacillus aceris]MBP1964947.1 glucose 1-dehydrogenase [Paenibacillus aceris]NHW35608.1 glucose 1-dehydrogenase [Paenibacillus aceris]
MYSDLAGKVAIVTGASQGIGRGIALRFGQEQMKVVINYHTDTSEAEQLAEEVKAAGGEAIAIQADVSKEAEVKELIMKTVQIFGGLDVLVNNAGIQTTCSSHELSLEDWHKVMDVNLTGAFVGCREALKYMLEHQIKGSIINMSSVHQKIPKPFHAHYASSKGGLKLLTESLALEYAPYGIRVNTIAPGAIATPMNEHILSDPRQKEDVLSLIPMNSIGEPKQIASAAAWLASEEANYVTGVTLFVDGGMTLYPFYLKG